MLYNLIRPIYFRYEPEEAHQKAMEQLTKTCKNGLMRKVLVSYCKPKIGEPIAAFGLLFNHVVGLAAGFDKNAAFLNELECLGFSHVEIGTVTPRPQDGNPKPRLFRLNEDEGLLNRMGFNNKGVDVAVENIKAYRNRANNEETAANRMIIGGNIGKNKDTPNEYAYMDYDICFRKLHEHVDYFVVNVSSPNTPGLRQLQEKEGLHQILTHLQGINKDMVTPKPLLLKIAPDLTEGQLQDIAEVALEIKLDGLVATNTTIGAEAQLSEAGQIRVAEAGNTGGISGAPLRSLATQVVKMLAQKTEGKIPIIASGGVFTAEDAREKMEAGACLVQVYTGFIYQGPDIVQQITKNLITA